MNIVRLGHVPGRPLGGRHGMVFGQIPAPPSAIGNASVPLVPGAYKYIHQSRVFSLFLNDMFYL